MGGQQPWTAGYCPQPLTTVRRLTQPSSALLPARQQAQKLAEQFMGGGEGKQGEAPVGDRPAGAAPASTTGGGGLMSMAQGMATEYFAGQGGNEAKPVGGGPTAAPAGGGSGLMGMAQGLAGEYFTGSEGKQVEGSSGGAMDVGLVDKLLAAFQHKEGKQVRGGVGTKSVSVVVCAWVCTWQPPRGGRQALLIASA